jgi:hypothetical protein
MIDIDAAQRRLSPTALTPRTNAEYRRIARWWELEAMRGYPSAEDSLRYARNCRWAAELAGLFGPGTWLELLVRSGHPHPDFPSMDTSATLHRVRTYGHS